MLSCKAYSDDSRFWSSGDTLFPLQENDISMSKEVLKIKWDANDSKWLVDVYFEFTNPGSERDLLIGFVTMPGWTEGDEPYTIGEGIINYEVNINGERVPYRIDKIMNLKSSATIQGLNDDEVFLSNIKFKHGINIITHKYIAFGGITGHDRYLNYVLSTGKYWADSTIGKFELYIEFPGKYLIDVDFDSLSELKLIGNSIRIKSRPSESGMSDEKEYIFLRSGYLYFTRNDYSPSKDIHISFNEHFEDVIDDNIFAMQGFKNTQKMNEELILDGVFLNSYEYLGKAQSNSDKTHDQLWNSMKALSADSLRILRNLPFAMHGYQFHSADLLNFYDQFTWYSPNQNVSPKKDILSSHEKEFVDYIDSLPKK